MQPTQQPQANLGTPPAFQDVTLYDQETGEPFTFTASEQEFFWKQGFTNVPKFSPERRKLKREQRYAGKPLFNVKCSVCGKVGKIVQEPLHPKRVLCEVCFTGKWEAYLEKHPEVRALHATEESGEVTLQQP